MDIEMKMGPVPSCPHPAVDTQLSGASCRHPACRLAKYIVISRIIEIMWALMRKSSLAVVGQISPAPRGDKPSAVHALAALAALGQPTRLEIFRLLIRHEPAGLAAGTIAAAIGCPQNTLSSHLGILARSGLARG